MPADPPATPWLDAWLEVERAFSELRVQAAKSSDPVAQGMRRLMEFGNDYAGIAADFWRKLEPGNGDFDGLRASLTARYQRLFTPPVAPAVAAADPLASSAAFVRYQRALKRFGRQTEAIALDAFRRLSASIGATDPAAPPITSLRELHELWIECGEAAYSNAAHSNEYAEAQAELLASLVELRREQLLRR